VLLGLHLQNYLDVEYGSTQPTFIGGFFVFFLMKNVSNCSC